MNIPIIQAAREGDVETVCALLAEDLQRMYVVDPRDDTHALPWAAWRGYNGIAHAL